MITCEWCGHYLARAHQQRLTGALVRRHCDQCGECDAERRQSARGVMAREAALADERAGMAEHDRALWAAREDGGLG